MNKKVPEIRFGGFDEEWKQYGWNNTVDISTNMVDPKSGNFDNLPHIGPDNIESYTGRLLNNIKSVKEDNLISWKFHFQSGDVIYGKINPQLGKYVLVNFEGLASADTYILNTKNGLAQSFLFRILQGTHFYKYSVSVSMRTGMPKINRNELNQFKYFSPTLKEQQKIGIFFKELDRIIALHQHELENLKKSKKAFLQKMFPKDGETVPEIRFPGFADEWKQHKLGNVAKIVGGGAPSTGISEYWNGNINWYSPVEIAEQRYVSSSQKKISELGLQKSSAKVLPIGTVLFTSRAGIGKTAILAEEGSTNQGFQSIVPNDKLLDTYFIFSRTNELKKYGEMTGAGSIFIEVSGKQMAKMPMLLPSFEEQIKIGNFFKQLDDSITLHQSKLNQLEKLKKAFLQKMFV